MTDDEIKRMVKAKYDRTYRRKHSKEIALRDARYKRTEQGKAVRARISKRYRLKQKLKHQTQGDRDDLHI